MMFEKFGSFEEIDKNKFSYLMVSGFGKKLTDGYFDYVNPDYICLAIENDQYHGAIVVEEFEPGLFYLDKIVVHTDHQSNGIGCKLWNILNGDSKKIIWRAKLHNPICNFYQQQCQGMHNESDWMIYWTGLEPDELASGIKYALDKKETLEELK
jgi:acetylglutamate synthase